MSGVFRSGKELLIVVKFLECSFRQKSLSLVVDVMFHPRIPKNMKPYTIGWTIIGSEVSMSSDYFEFCSGN